MGMAAALKLRPIIENVRSILSIELLAASEAIDLLAPLRTGQLAEKARRLVRHAAPSTGGDRPLHAEIARVAEMVVSGEFAAILQRGRKSKVKS